MWRNFGLTWEWWEQCLGETSSPGRDKFTWERLVHLGARRTRVVEGWEGLIHSPTRCSCSEKKHIQSFFHYLSGSFITKFFPAYQEESNLWENKILATMGSSLPLWRYTTVRYFWQRWRWTLSFSVFLPLYLNIPFSIFASLICWKMLLLIASVENMEQ